MQTFSVPMLTVTKRNGQPHAMISLALATHPPFMALDDALMGRFLEAMLACASGGGVAPYDTRYSPLREAGLILVSEDGSPSPAAPAAPRPPRVVSSELRGEPQNPHAVPMFAFPCDGTPDKVRIFSDFVDEMSRLFPSVEVAFQLNKALAWTLARPERRKTARGLRRFLTSWLDRAQNDAWRNQRAA
jgi:hypothetical protein